MRSCSEQEGNNGHAQGRVVAELLQVAAVFALGPDSHLGEAHQGEEGHWDTLSQDGKANPGAHLISVVGTGHQQEQPGEGVLGGVWDLPGFRPSGIEWLLPFAFKENVICQGENCVLVQFFSPPQLSFLGFPSPQNH